MKKNNSVEYSHKTKDLLSKKESKGPDVNPKLVEKTYGSFIQNTTINLNSNLANNQTKNTKNDFYKDKDRNREERLCENNCVCYKFEDDKIHTLFNNNICRICGRDKNEKSFKTETNGNSNTNYTTTNNANSLKSTEKSNPSSVGKSSILTDLNMRLSALKTKDDKLLNNYMNNNKSNTNIKNDNVKYIGDKGINLEKKKYSGDNINYQNNNKNIDNTNLAASLSILNYYM
jgi:hypothetical protein